MAPLGFGESYMDGWWDVQDLDELVFRVASANVDSSANISWENLTLALKNSLLNVQTRFGVKKLIRTQYNLNSHFFELFLFPYNQYTCFYFKDTNDPAVAEEKRLDLICRKLELTKSDKVLDIGSGWGGFARYASEKYGCHVTGISVSKEQNDYARKYTKGLPVTIKYLDYHKLHGKFNKVFSGGMIEHVGAKNHRTYMAKIHRVLSDDGLFLLDCLGESVTRKNTDAWTDKYIFPNSLVPSATQMIRVIEGLFVIEDWHNFGNDYAKTCVAWFERFDQNWKKIQKLGEQFDNRFYRMWKLYLLASAGYLRARHIQQWQIVLSKKGVIGGYVSVR